MVTTLRHPEPWTPTTTGAPGPEDIRPWGRGLPVHPGGAAFGAGQPETLGVPVSRWPEKRWEKVGSELTVTVRSYQPLV